MIEYTPKKILSKKSLAVDLFSGAGGFSLAAIREGFHIAFAVENDKFAVKTYQDNISNYGPVSKVEVLKENILEYCPEQVAGYYLNGAECDLLLGGPPCQGFSTHRIRGAGIDDPRNELVLAYFGFVRAIRPRVFLMENVPGILWPRHEKHLKRLYREGEKAGYYMFPPVTIDARDFGVPQRRKRVFVLGVRDFEESINFEWPPKATHAASSKVKKGQAIWLSCKNVFAPAPDNDINNIHMNHGPELIEAFRKTPPNGGSRTESGRILPCHRQHNGHTDVYGRINPFEPAPTMTTACINPSKGRFVHPTEHHGITLRQAARIQTFPDEFVFHGGLMAAGKQIGNAVPVRLGQVLIKHIKRYLLNNTNDFSCRQLTNVTDKPGA